MFNNFVEHFHVLLIGKLFFFCKGMQFSCDFLSRFLKIKFWIKFILKVCSLIIFSSGFQHFLDEKLKISMFADMPYLFELAKNHFIDNGFDVRRHRMDKKYIKWILSICAKDVKVSYNIFQYHLHVQGYEKQKVLPTIFYIIQLLSERTASIE